MEGQWNERGFLKSENKRLKDNRVTSSMFSNKTTANSIPNKVISQKCGPSEDIFERHKQRLLLKLTRKHILQGEGKWL